LHRKNCAIAGKYQNCAVQDRNFLVGLGTCVQCVTIYNVF